MRCGLRRIFGCGTEKAGLRRREDLQDAPLGGFGLGLVVVQCLLAEAEGGPFAVIGEAGGGEVFYAHEDLPVATAQIEVAVAMQLERVRQRLSRPRGAALAGMVDECKDGGLEATLEVAQEAEGAGNLGDDVLVDAEQAEQGVEDHEAGRDALHGLVQALAVGAMLWGRR